MRKFIKTLIITILLLAIHGSQAQDKRLDQWYTGSITLKEQRQLEGYVNVNFTTQNVRFVADHLHEKIL